MQLWFSNFKCLHLILNSKRVFFFFKIEKKTRMEKASSQSRLQFFVYGGKMLDVTPE